MAAVAPNVDIHEGIPLSEVQRVAAWLLHRRQDLLETGSQLHGSSDDLLQEIALRFLQSRAGDRVGTQNKLSTLASQTAIWSCLPSDSRNRAKLRYLKRVRTIADRPNEAGSANRFWARAAPVSANAQRIEDADEARFFLSHLTDQERDVVCRALMQGENQSAIGASMGLSKARISQIKLAAIKKLQAVADDR